MQLKHESWEYGPEKLCVPTDISREEWEPGEKLEDASVTFMTRTQATVVVAIVGSTIFYNYQTYNWLSSEINREQRKVDSFFGFLRSTKTKPPQRGEKKQANR